MNLTRPIHGTHLPSDWIVRWAHLAAPGAAVLDLACGSGRHFRWWAARGHPVTGVDVNDSALAGLNGLGELIRADLENAPWPLDDRQFDVIVVTNYLWRPLWPTIVNALAPGGVLLYETFACGNETVGRPSRPDFLLQPAELIERCAGLEIVAFEDGYLPDPDRFVQRIAAVRPLSPGAPRRRFHLSNPNSTQG